MTWELQAKLTSSRGKDAQGWPFILAHATANTATTGSIMQATLSSVAALRTCLRLLDSRLAEQPSRECRNWYVLEMALVAEKHESKLECLILHRIILRVNIKRCASFGDQFWGWARTSFTMGTVDKFSCVGLSTGAVMSTELCRKFFHALCWLNQKKIALPRQARALVVHVGANEFHRHDHAFADTTSARLLGSIAVLQTSWRLMSRRAIQ